MAKESRRDRVDFHEARAFSSSSKIRLETGPLCKSLSSPANAILHAHLLLFLSLYSPFPTKLFTTLSLSLSKEPLLQVIFYCPSFFFYRRLIPSSANLSIRGRLAVCGYDQKSSWESVLAFDLILCF